MWRRSWSIAVVLAAVFASPATAAPMIAAQRACFSPGQTMTLSGAGFTPSSPVDLFFSLNGAFGTDFRLAGSPLTSDAAGELDATRRAPDLLNDRDDRETLDLVAEDRARITTLRPPTLEAVGTARVLLSRWTVFVESWSTGRVHPRRSVRVRVIGFVPATRLWVHYLRGGKVVASRYLGRLRPPCGDLETRMREFPFRPSPGTYRVAFQDSRRYDRRKSWVAYTRVRVRG